MRDYELSRIASHASLERLGHNQYLVRPGSVDSLNPAARPGDLHCRDPNLLAQPEMDALIAGRIDSIRSGHVFIEGASGTQRKLDLCSDRIPIASRPLQLQKEPVIGRASLFLEEHRNVVQP